MSLSDYSAFALVALLIFVSFFVFMTYVFLCVVGIILNTLTNFLIKWYNRASYLVIDMFERLPKIRFNSRM